MIARIRLGVADDPREKQMVGPNSACRKEFGVVKNDDVYCTLCYRCVKEEHFKSTAHLKRTAQRYMSESITLARNYDEGNGPHSGILPHRILPSVLKESEKEELERRYGFHAQCSVGLRGPMPGAPVACAVCRYGAM